MQGDKTEGMTNGRNLVCDRLECLHIKSPYHRFSNGGHRNGARKFGFLDTPSKSAAVSPGNMVKPPGLPPSSVVFYTILIIFAHNAMSTTKDAG